MNKLNLSDKEHNAYDISDDIPLEISIDEKKKKNAIEYAKKTMICIKCKYFSITPCEWCPKMIIDMEAFNNYGCTQWGPEE